MKSALVCKSLVPLPEPHRSAVRGSEKAKPQAALLQRTPNPSGLGRIVGMVAGWFTPGCAEEDAPRRPDPGEIEALEEHIRKFTEEHRFTGFPC